MRKIFSCLLLIILITSQIAKADQHLQYATKVSIYKGQWQFLTPNGGTKRYTVNNIPQALQLTVQFTNFDNNAQSVNLANLWCGLDPGVTDFDTNTNAGKFTNIKFSYLGANVTNSFINLAGGQVAGSGGTISTAVLPCSTVVFEFNSSSQVSSNIEIVAFFSGQGQVVGATASDGSLGASGTLGNVQGIVPPTTNGVNTFPIVNGGVQPAINAGFTVVGIDNFNSTFVGISAGATGTFTVGNPPTPTTNGETSLVFYGPSPNTGFSGLNNPPWACLPSQSCLSSSNQPLGAFVNNTSSSTTFKVTVAVGGAASVNTAAVFVDVSKNPTIRQAQISNIANPAFGSNTLAGSTLINAYYFNSNTAVGCISSISDTQGNVWKQITGINVASPGGLGTGGTILVWASTTVSSAGADTVTATLCAGSAAINGTNLLELTNLTSANLNTPTVPQVLSNNKFSANETENRSSFSRDGGYVFVKTYTLSGAATTTDALWDATQHGVFTSCVVHQRVTAIAGTTPTLNTFLQDSGDNIGFADRLSMVQATATGNQIGQIALFQVGTTAATAASAAASTDGVLAAGSSIPGNGMGPFGRLKLVLGGTGPSATVTETITCK